MEEVFEDVLKVNEEIKNALGFDQDVNPNQIFVKLEALLHESSSVRVIKVTKDLISELQPAKTRSRSLEELKTQSKSDDAELEDMVESEQEESPEMERDIIMGEKSVLVKDEAGKDPDSDSLRSTPVSIISITDEDR